MKHAASKALADAVRGSERSIGIVIPSLFYSDVHHLVAQAVQRAAGAAG